MQTLAMAHRRRVGVVWRIKETEVKLRTAHSNTSAVLASLLMETDALQARTRICTKFLVAQIFLPCACAKVGSAAVGRVAADMIDVRVIFCRRADQTVQVDCLQLSIDPSNSAGVAVFMP